MPPDEPELRDIVALLAAIARLLATIDDSKLSDGELAALLALRLEFGRHIGAQ